MNRSHFASRWTVFALLGSLSMATGACGFIFSHGPPQGHEQMNRIPCTESNTGPILDVIWAGVNVLAAIAAVTGPGPEPVVSRGALVAYSLSWGLLSVGAAGVGFDKSKKCRTAKRALAQRQAQRGDHSQQRGLYPRPPNLRRTNNGGPLLPARLPTDTTAIVIN